jgi:ankyrin repeat protein
MQSKSLQPSHPVLMSSEHKEWRTSSGPRILYIHGKDHRATREAAEQIYLSWQATQRDKKLYESKVFSFSFSSRDPARDSTIDFLSSLVLQCCSVYRTGHLDDDFQIIQDQFQLHHRWTEKDLLNLFMAQDNASNTLLLLQDIDQCKGWEEFWTVLNGLAATTESSLALVVTSGPSRPLHDKTKAWPDLPVHQYTLTDSIENLNATSEEEEYLDKLISSLCPSGHGEAQIRKSLQKLMGMSKDTLIKSLELIKVHTNWPKAASIKTLSKFCALLELVTPSSTPAMVLDQILRSNHDQDRFRWILKWLLCGYRPLTRRELAMLLCRFQRTEEWAYVTPSSTDLQDAIHQLDIWLCGIVDFSHDQVCIRDDIWDLLEPGMAYLWGEVRSTASGTILKYILAYFSMPEVQENLGSKYSQYASLVQASGDEITPPLCPDGQDIVFYAVQAFPHHLSENPLVLKALEKDLVSCQGPMTLWMKVYWAMSNPFSRPGLKTLSSASETLLTSENLSPRAVKILRKFKRTWPDKTDGKNDFGLIRKLSQMDTLVEATRADDQGQALLCANQIVSASKTQRSDESDQDLPGEMLEIPWPSSVLWMATWLKMDRLVNLLLENGMNPDPDDNASRFFPSPLYMAAFLGHAMITRALLRYGAKVDVLRAERLNSIHIAAGMGHIDVIKALVEKDDSLLELQTSGTPLFMAALNGNWKAVEALCALKADPDSGIGPGSVDRWAPLLPAAENGFVKTLKVLLANKADVNISGPSGDTPLWFAAVRAASLECVRILLDKKADPNHELINPPLLVEMMQSGLSVEDRLAIFDLLIHNNPPVQLDKADPDSGMTPLMHAAQAGETAVVKWLLEHGADVNMTDDIGMGALDYSIANRQVEVLRELLKWEPQLDRVTSSGDILLQIAADDASIVEMLLDAGANVELTNSSGQTVFNVAVGKEKADVVRLLASRKVDIHHRDQYGWTPILDATGFVPNAEILRILVESGANLKDTLSAGQTPLHLAAISSNPEILKILLEFHGALDLEKRDDDGETPLLGLRSDTQMESVKLLVRAGANINAQDSRGWTPLMKAVNGSMPNGAVDFLLSQPDIEVDIQGKAGTALHIACRRLSLSDLTKLVSHGADPNHHVLRIGSTPLIASCFPPEGVRSQHLEPMERVVRELIEHPEHPADVKAMHGTTVYNAICAAALGGGPGIIDYLLTAGASIRDQDPLGRVPIHFAAANGIKNFEFVKLAHKEDIMVPDLFGKNVLHWAAQFGHAETVEDILNSFANVRERNKYINKADVDGWTALCWACRPFTGGWAPGMASEERDFAGTIRCLLGNGADRTVECRMGQGDRAETFTPLKLAKLCNADDKIIGLLAHGLEGNLSSDAKQVKIDSETQDKKYTASSMICDICLTVSQPVIFSIFHYYHHLRTPFPHLHLLSVEPRQFLIRLG